MSIENIQMYVKLRAGPAGKEELYNLWKQRIEESAVVVYCER